jgi:cob(I)alamin adenosyltransferase
MAVSDAGVRELAPLTKAYMNRLSSLLFALARLANAHAGVPEENPRY